MKTHDYLAHHTNYFFILFNPAKDIQIIPKPTINGFHTQTNANKPFGDREILVLDLDNIKSYNAQKDIKTLIPPSNAPNINRVLIGIDFMSIGFISIDTISPLIIGNNCFVLTFLEVLP
jgi:hypothetical protein